MVKRTKETNGANLVQGFAHLIEDLASGKGIVQRRTDPTAFEKGKTIAATPGEVVFQNELFQLIQYTPTTDKVAAEPLLYVPPLVNRYYMIDLVPGRAWSNGWSTRAARCSSSAGSTRPRSTRTRASSDYVLDGVVDGDRAGRASAPAARPTCSPSASAGRWSRSRWPGWPRRAAADEVNSATLIGSLVDFADMRDWSAFVHEGHLGALEDHLEEQGFIDSLELQRLFAAMRANDLIWSAWSTIICSTSPRRRATCSTGSRMARASRPPSSRATTATCCSTTA